MVFAVYEGKKIYYTVTGQGPCVLLLHGFMEDHSIWNELRQRLEKNYKVVCVDLPGHAASEILGATHTMQTMAEAMWRVLITESIGQAVLVGHSLGGYVALEMAKIEPKRTRGVCMLHSSALDDTDIKKKERDRVIKVLELNPDLFIKEAIPNLFAEKLRGIYVNEIAQLTQLALSHNPMGLIATTRGMRDRNNNVPWLSETTIAVHFIIGKNDPVIPFDFYKTQLTAGNHITSFISERAGHMGFIEDKEPVLGSVTEFIKQHAL